VKRLAWIALTLAACLGATDTAEWIAGTGGVAGRDRNGKIVAVDLRASWVTDSDLGDLAGLPSLSRLDLSLTRITDHGLQQLKNAPGITELNLRYAELITDAGLVAVKGWKRLKRLNLRGTKITDTTLQHLSGVTSLEALDIGFVQVTDVGLDALTSLPNLKELVIGGNKLTDVGLQPLRQMPGLIALDLSGQQRTDSGLWSISLTEPGLDAVATLKNLRHLRLNGTGVSARGLEKLTSLVQLERLDLQGCSRIGDDAAPVLAAFPALRVVDLTGTPVTGKGIAALRRARPECKVIAGSGAVGSQQEEPED
jgi:Leucine-rich repeat (LRR) protein